VVLQSFCLYDTGRTISQIAIVLTIQICFFDRLNVRANLQILLDGGTLGS
jgi:hypothetical protein